jgi:hypothetical protein
MTDEEILAQRELEYGSATKSFNSIARLWSEYLEYDITGEQVALMMTLLKIHRSKTSSGFHLKDSLQDARNYITLAEKVSDRLIVSTY